jgi:hypothetical protein
VVGTDHPSLPGPEAEDTVGSRAGEQHPSFPPAAQLPGPVVGESTGGAHRADPAQRSDRRLAIVLACLAAIVLVGGGLEIGSRLGNDSGATAQQQSAAGLPPGPPPGDPPGPPGESPATRPDVTVNQPRGDAQTTFVVSGRGWRPDTRITLTLDGRPVAPKGPATDRQGAFNYTLNQGQEMFPTGLKVGEHTVTASGPGGQRVEKTFRVVP